MGFDCPGCNMLHVMPTSNWKPEDQEHAEMDPRWRVNRAQWEFNGDLERPTFSPSLLVTYEWGPERKKCVCHSYVREGRIQFLHDCTHELAGKTVDLPPVDEGLTRGPA